LVSDEIYQALADGSAGFGSFGHGFTYSAHPLPAAVALETLRIYEERDIVAQVRAVAPRFQKHLHAFADHPLVGETRGVGLIGAVELVTDKATHRPFPATVGAGARVARASQEAGLIHRAMGDSLAFSPPLVISDGDIDILFDRFARALDAAASTLTPT
jgi:4-aminobutyrate--pyruvate transaminase